MRRGNGFWWITYLIFFFLWILANYPALFHSWWYRDDFVYGLLVQKMSLLPGLEEIYLGYTHDGRPFAILVEWTFGLNYYPHTHLNIALHWLQGAGHAGVALLIVSILGRHLPRWQAAVAVVPFLLWCFNGEPVLYSSAYHYVGAAFFSLLGLHFILEGGDGENNRPCLLGAILTFSALLILQSSATAGLIVWVITVALRLLQFGTWQKTAMLKEGSWLTLSFVAGGLITTWMAVNAKSLRAEGAHDFLGKVDYWIHLNRFFFFWPKYYPVSLDFFHGLLLFLGMVVPLYLLLKTKRTGILPLMLMLFLATLILPYLGNLLVVANWMSYRSFYLAPLSITFLIAVLFRLEEPSRKRIVLLVILVAAICLNYMVIGQKNARDYVTTYRGELQVIRELKETAAESHLNLIAALPDSSPSNPFAINYPWLDAHECDFRSEYSLGPSILLLSPLSILVPTGAEKALLEEKIRTWPVAPAIQIHPLPELHLIYLQVSST